jgi:hypothetical protein
VVSETPKITIAALEIVILQDVLPVRSIP